MVLGNGGTTWRMADASPPDRDGWQRVPVDPHVVAARVAGLSHGFLVFDDTGSEWTRAGEKFTFRLFPNRFVYSREQNRASAPYFTIELGPDDRRPPAAPSGLRVEPGTALLPAGEALVSWVTPRDDGPAGTLGFFVTLDGRALPRELIPLAGAAGERVEMHLRDLKLSPGASANLSVRAVDGAGNLGTGGDSRHHGLEPSTRAPAPAQNRRPRTAPPGGDVAAGRRCRGRHPRRAGQGPPGHRRNDSLPARGLPGRQPSLGRRRRARSRSRRRGTNSSPSRSCCAAASPWGPIKPELVFDGPAGKTMKVELGRYQPVASKLGPLPDPIVPLNFPAAAAPADQESESARRGVCPARPGGRGISRHVDVCVVRSGQSRFVHRRTGRCGCRWCCASGTSPCPITSASCPR